MPSAETSQPTADARRHPWRWFVALYLGGVLSVALVAGSLHALVAALS